MTGFWVLARKELLEQRRSWKFVALVAIFAGLALLITLIHAIVDQVNDLPNTASEARDVLRGFGIVVTTIGTFLAIIVGMGSLAGERASGTAAMTLSKPVTRSAFVSTKFLGLVASIFASLAISCAVLYVLTMILIGSGGLVGFATYMAVIGVYLVFIGSIAFFWSAMFTRPLLAGGIALLLFIAQVPLSEIPRTQRYWPMHTVQWADSLFPDVRSRPIDETIEAARAPVLRGDLPDEAGFIRSAQGGVSVVVEATRGTLDSNESGTFVPLTYERFIQLQSELAGLNDIDGLTVMLEQPVFAMNPRVPGVQMHIMATGMDSSSLGGFDKLRFISGDEAPLNELAEGEGYVSERASKDLNIQAGDRLQLLGSEESVFIDIRGVVRGRLVERQPTLIMPLEHVQRILGRGDEVSRFLVSNRGDEISGANLSPRVTRELRLLFADRAVVSNLKDLLDQPKVLDALERRLEILGGFHNQDIARLRDELRKPGLSDELVGLLAKPIVISHVMEALRLEGLTEEAEEAVPLFTQQAEFVVLNGNRRFDEGSDRWAGFLIALGLVVALSFGAWGVFSRKEL